MQKVEEIELTPMLETTMMVTKEARGTGEEQYFRVDNIEAYLHANWDGPIERDRNENIFYFSTKNI